MLTHSSEEMDINMKKIQLGGHRKNSDVKGYAIVDSEQFDLLNEFKWCLNNNGYAVTRGKHNQKGKLIFMHHLVFGIFPLESLIDHINRNPLDNRVNNLRIANKSENGINRMENKNNTSGYKGVTYLKNNNKWMAGIKINYKRKYLGSFNTALEASIAYDKEAKKQFGDYSYLNKSKLCTSI